MAEDRRQVPRIAFPGTVYVHDGNSFHTASLADIGLGGIALIGQPMFKLGTAVRIVVKSGWLEMPLQAHGIVVRTDYARSSLAVQFTVTSTLFELLLYRAAKAHGEPSWKWVSAS